MIDVLPLDRARATTIAFVALVTMLVLVGCGRPLFSGALRDNWSGIVVGLALAAAAARALRPAPSSDELERWLFALLPLALAALYLQPQRVASDGIFYYAPLRSLVVDFDLDFENEYRVLGAEPGYFQRTATGRLPNTWSVGPALLWSPFFLAAHGLALAGLYRPTGFGYPYFTAIATGTALFGFAGVVLLFRLLKSHFEPAVALTATLLVWLATFHVWYMVFEPSMSHALAMASVAGFFLLTHRGIQGPRRFAWMGAAGGLVALIRWQNVLYLPVALVTSWAAHGRPQWKELAAGAAAFLVAFSPQLVYWRALYGSFFLVPQGGGYLDWGSPELASLLFSSRHGLFAWAPVLYLGVAGFPGFLRKAPAFGGALLVSALAAVYVNASVHDWWAGASFGSRRFDGALPALGLGIAVSVGWLAASIRERPLRAAGAFLAVFVVWNAMLMGVYFVGAVPPDGPASFRQAAGDGIELVYRRTGYPFSWPGAILDRLRYGAPLASYDLHGSRSLSNNVDLRIGDTDALHLGTGWSLPRRGRNETLRTLEPSGAEVWLALREPADYTLSVASPSTGNLAVEWNGAAVGRLELSEGAASLLVSHEHVRSGVNRLRLTPQGSDPISVSRVRLMRPGDSPE